MVAGFRIAHSAGDLYGFLLQHSPLYGPSRSLCDLAFNLSDVPRHGATPRMAPAPKYFSPPRERSGECWVPGAHWALRWPARCLHSASISSIAWTTHLAEAGALDGARHEYWAQQGEAVSDTHIEEQVS